MGECLKKTAEKMILLFKSVQQKELAITWNYSLLYLIGKVGEGCGGVRYMKLFSDERKTDADSISCTCNIPQLFLSNKCMWVRERICFLT